MSMTPAQDVVATLLRSHRSQHSWIAGSAVLHHLLGRHPGDLDIHHPNAGAAGDAVRADLATLLEHGFAIDGSAWQETERWARFRHDTGSVVLNWVVVEAAELAVPRPHPVFGYAVAIEHAIAEKLRSARASGRRKDLDDLRALSRAGVPLPAELHPRDIAMPPDRRPAGPDRARR